MKIKLLRQTLSVLLLVAGGFALAADGTELEQAHRLMEEGQVVEALARIDRHLAQQPDDPKGRFLKGLALVRLEKNEEAIEVFRSLAADYPDLPEPHNNLAVLYAATGEYEKARDALLMAIRTHPSYATAHENLGDIYAKMAAEAYDKALVLDDANPTAKAKLALVNELFPVSDSSAPVALTSVRSSAAPRRPPAAGPSDGTQQELMDVVSRWAAAWSAQDVDEYLGYYASGFRPQNGATRDAWEAERRRRVSKPASIRVSLDQIAASSGDDGRGRVQFVQGYQSDTYQDRVRKTLGMVREQGTWKIISERSSPIR